MNLLKKIGLVWVLSVAGYMPATAQSEADSLLRAMAGYGTHIWSLSENPVFLKNSSLLPFASAGFCAKYTGGNFKRPQEFQQERLAGFGAEGLSSAGNWRFYGEFRYGKHDRDSIRYANVARPYEGNPFITADAVGGNWKGDGLLAHVQLLAPAWGKWQFGLKAVYETEQSARNNDPKPLYRLLNYAISPAISYLLNDQHTIALTGSYENSYEHTETGYYTDRNPILYSIRGYGEFYSGPVVSAERFRTGRGWQLGSDYCFTHEKVTFLAGVRLGYRTADVNDGIAKPVFIGGWDEQRATVFLGFERRQARSGWIANLKGWLSDGTGFDPVFGSVNPAAYLSGLHGKLSWYTQRHPQKWFSITLYPALTYMNYFESIAKTDWTSTMLHIDAGIAVNRTFKNLSLLAELTAGYHFNLQQDIVINRPTLLSPILVRPDFIANTTNFIRTMANISGIYRRNNTGYGLRLGADLRNAVQQDIPRFSDRNTYHIGFYLIF